MPYVRHASIVALTCINFLLSAACTRTSTKPASTTVNDAGAPAASPDKCAAKTKVSLNFKLADGATATQTGALAVGSAVVSELSTSLTTAGLTSAQVDFIAANSSLAMNAAVGSINIDAEPIQTVAAPIVQGAFLSLSDACASLTDLTQRSKIANAIVQSVTGSLGGRTAKMSQDAVLTVIKTVVQSAVQNLPKAGLADSAAPDALGAVTRGVVGALGKAGLPTAAIGTGAQTVATAAVTTLKDLQIPSPKVGQLAGKIASGSITGLAQAGLTATDATSANAIGLIVLGTTTSLAAAGVGAADVASSVGDITKASVSALANTNLESADQKGQALAAIIASMMKGFKDICAGDVTLLAAASKTLTTAAVANLSTSGLAAAEISKATSVVVFTATITISELVTDAGSAITFVTSIVSGAMIGTATLAAGGRISADQTADGAVQASIYAVKGIAQLQAQGTITATADLSASISAVAVNIVAGLKAGGVSDDAAASVQTNVVTAVTSDEATADLKVSAADKAQLSSAVASAVAAAQTSSQVAASPSPTPSPSPSPQVDDTPAPTLSFTAISPGFPVNNPTPTLTLSLAKAATVTLYSESTCTSAVSAATALTNGDGKTITANTLPAASVTTFYAKAVDAGGRTSACTFLAAFSQVMRFVDPNPTGNFGQTVVLLTNGNVVITSPNATIGSATAAGAVYLFNGTSGALISTLTGTNTNDTVGNTGVTALTNGNFVVQSSNWNGTLGAVTWVNGSTGLNDVVSASNSLVGTTAGDSIGRQVIALTNGNYVTASLTWTCATGCSGSITNAGAATWGSGTTGISGPVTTTNSLVGSGANDRVGGMLLALTNGNYLVRSWFWSCHGQVACGTNATFAGAVTWGNGTTGITGTVSPTNSLVGTSNNDVIGGNNDSQIIALSNGNYVVGSMNWTCTTVGGCSQTLAAVGAATWCDGTSGRVGPITKTNSLVGSSANDQVTRTQNTQAIFSLTNGNYVVVSQRWNCPATTTGCGGGIGTVGAVTWASGTTGITGDITPANSLVGSTPGDAVGHSVFVLANGNYVVRSSDWTNNGLARAGAVTFGNGTGGTVGPVTTANSLVGSTAQDQLGSYGINALANGDYVVRSARWDCTVAAGCAGTIVDAGAVTLGSGTTGIAGPVTTANSLVGGSPNDMVGGGWGNVVELSNGNFLVVSQQWNLPAGMNGNDTLVPQVGAVTFINRSAGTKGTVTIANSLIGSSPQDNVGDSGVTPLTNGNYVVSTRQWDCKIALGCSGDYQDAGHITWGSGTVGVVGAVSAANSVVGDSAAENIGDMGVLALPNGAYVAFSRYFNCTVAAGCASDAAHVGAATWDSGTSAITGVLTPANSIVGSHTNDVLGQNGGQVLANGNYLVGIPSWGGTGAVYVGSGAASQTGAIQ